MLFSGTIQDNILYGLVVEGKTKEEIKVMMDEACSQANALLFIEDKSNFPLGYDTLVGERGVKLSGG